MMEVIPRFGMNLRPRRTFFDRFFDDLQPPAVYVEESDWMPPADMTETDTEYFVTVDLPGVGMEAVDITYMEGILTLKGEKKTETGDHECSHCSERYSGSFRRNFRIPGLVDGDKIDATYKDGVLRVTLPKSPESRVKNIKVH